MLGCIELECGAVDCRLVEGRVGSAAVAEQSEELRGGEEVVRGVEGKRVQGRMGEEGAKEGNEEGAMLGGELGGSAQGEGKAAEVREAGEQARKGSRGDRGMLEDSEAQGAQRGETTENGVQMLQIREICRVP